LRQSLAPPRDGPALSTSEPVRQVGPPVRDQQQE